MDRITGPCDSPMGYAPGVLAGLRDRRDLVVALAAELGSSVGVPPARADVPYHEERRPSGRVKQSLSGGAGSFFTLFSNAVLLRAQGSTRSRPFRSSLASR